MRRTLVTAALLVFAVSSREARGQWGGFGGRGQGMGGGGFGREAAAPRLPGAELDGPPDSAMARTLLDFSDQQAARYGQAYDSFMVATRPQRDSARAVTEKMNDRLDSGDRAAALFYAERLQELGRYLKDRQDKFEVQLRHLLTGDQSKSYRRWKEDQERAAEEKAREDALRWRQAAFGGERMAPLAGALVGAGNLAAQALRAFANLGAVLRATGASPPDVVALTIYVVDYKPSELAAIRDAGAAYFGANAPITTVLGVQSLSREGALIAVGATAVTGATGFARGPARNR